MKPVDQASDHDCLRACIASIFELLPGEVPQFGAAAIGTERASLAQDEDLRNWLSLRGIGLLHVTNPKIVFAQGGKSAQCPWGYCVAGGKSPRGDWDHAIVYDARDGEPKMVHDPHPSRAGFAGDPSYFTCFLLEDPGLLKRRFEVGASQGKEAPYSV